MDTQLKKGVLDLCVLSIVKKKDHYGYELVRKISNSIQVTEGTLYPILRRLKNEGYLQTYLRESKEGPARKYYALTKSGEKKFMSLKNEWNDFTKKINLILK